MRTSERGNGPGSWAGKQLDMFAHVAAVYADSPGGRVENITLYREVAARAGIDEADLEAKSKIGRDGRRRSLIKRAIRWHQQSLRAMGVLQHVDGERGIWELSEENKGGLHSALPGVKLVAFSTKLGVAIWGDCAEVFADLDQPIALSVCSPPYPLRYPRAYGNPTDAAYVDFIVGALAPIARHLMPGGSICLNISNDCFEVGSPARSMYCERLLLALHDRLGLQLMDRLIWHNPSKAPGPIQWASKARVQLNTAYEPIYWLTNDPMRVRSDNRRVLEPHTDKHRRFVSAGGSKRTGSYADGAYTMRPGRFANVTEGKIPRNVIMRGHRCADAIQYRERAKDLGLPAHGAVYPTSIPDFLIRFLTEVGDLVVDPFGGKATTALAAERLGRRWMVAEKVIGYLRGGAEAFRGYDGFQMPATAEEWPAERMSRQGGSGTRCQSSSAVRAG